MKKTVSRAGVVLLLTGFPMIAAATVPPSTVGRVVLQVQSHGEAWYVNPETMQRTYLADGAAAYALMRSSGLGIANMDLKKIPIGLDQRFNGADSDGDGLDDQTEAALGTDPTKADSDGDDFTDGAEVANGYDPLSSDAKRLAVDASLVKRLAGRILLQVASHGEAWYVNPTDGKRYYMKDASTAYAIMRFLGLGISDTDLARIPAAPLSVAPAPVSAAPAPGPVKDCGDDAACFRAALASGTPAAVTMLKLVPAGFQANVIFHMRLTVTSEGGSWRYTETPVSVERLGEEHRAWLEALLKTSGQADNGEVDKLIAANTSAGLLAAGAPQAQVDAFFAPDFLDKLLAASGHYSCAAVDLAKLSPIISKWEGQSFSFDESVDASGVTTLAGDYAFGQCVATK
jgi:hypothetical protein